jgi:hypothetical protein
MHWPPLFAQQSPPPSSIAYLAMKPLDSLPRSLILPSRAPWSPNNSLVHLLRWSFLARRLLLRQCLMQSLRLFPLFVLLVHQLLRRPNVFGEQLLLFQISREHFRLRPPGLVLMLANTLPLRPSRSLVPARNPSVYLALRLTIRDSKDLLQRALLLCGLWLLSLPFHFHPGFPLSIVLQETSFSRSPP